MDYKKQFLKNFNRVSNLRLNEDIGGDVISDIQDDIKRHFNDFDTKYLKREELIPQVYEIPNGRFELDYDDGIEFQGTDDETGQAKVFYELNYKGIYDGRNVLVSINITIVPQMKYDSGNFKVENQYFLEDININSF